MRSPWAGAAAVLVLLAGGAISWLVLRPSHPATSPTSTPQNDTAKLEAALNSTTLSGQLTALAPSLRELASEQRVRLLPPGSRVALLPETFARTSADAARVEATVSDGQRFRLLLVREGGEWLLVATEPMS
jgi:hypothetical protein